MTDLEYRVRRAVEQEREACAEAIDEMRRGRQGRGHWGEDTLALRDAARLIRARSQAVMSCSDVDPDDPS